MSLGKITVCLIKNPQRLRESCFLVTKTQRLGMHCFILKILRERFGFKHKKSTTEKNHNRYSTKKNNDWGESAVLYTKTITTEGNARFYIKKNHNDWGKIRCFIYIQKAHRLGEKNSLYTTTYGNSPYTNKKHNDWETECSTVLYVRKNTTTEGSAQFSKQKNNDWGKCAVS